MNGENSGIKLVFMLCGAERAMLLLRGSPEHNGGNCFNLFKVFQSIQFFINMYLDTVRPLETRPQAALTLQVHVFESGPKEFEMNKFM